MEYILNIAILIGIYIILGISLNLLAGYAGQISLAHAAFFGCGAYASALITVRDSSQFMLGVLIGILACVLISFVVSFVAFRLRDDYFAIVTLALGLVFFGLLSGLTDLTRGPLGVHGIPYPTILGWDIDSNAELLVITVMYVIGIAVVSILITRSPLGRVLKSIREDEIFTKSVGKDPQIFKRKIFIISATMAGLAGNLYAHFISYIAPSTFSIEESVFVLAIVIIGGSGSLWGSVAGAVVLVTLPELLRFTGFPGPMAANLRQIIYGAVLTLIVIFRPQGLMGEYTFQKESTE